MAVSFLEFKHHLEPNMPLAPGDVKSPRARLDPWLPSSSIVALLIGKVAARGAGGADTHVARRAGTSDESSRSGTFLTDQTATTAPIIAVQHMRGVAERQRLRKFRGIRRRIPRAALKVIAPFDGILLDRRPRVMEFRA